jgi:hypothetical protein
MSEIICKTWQSKHFKYLDKKQTKLNAFCFS